MLAPRLGWQESYSYYYTTSLPHVSNAKIRVWVKCISKWLVFVLLLVCLLATLLWDMQNLSDLSKTIHDDHSSFWVRIKKKDLRKWLSPLDMCILQNNHVPNITTEKYVAKNCSKEYAKQRQRGSFFKNFCSIGVGLGSDCSLPGIDRPYFRMKISDSVIGNKSRYNLKSSMKYIAKYNKALVFVGGATTKQNTQALFCELLRVDDSVSIRGDVVDPVNVTIFWTPKDRRQPPQSLDVHYVPFWGIPLDPELETNFSYAGKRHNYRRHHTDLPELRLTIASIRRSYQGLVVVINMGTSYISRMKFRDDVSYVLDWLNELGADSKNLILFRESPATHWNHTSSGYMSLDSSVDEPSECVPIEDASNPLDWRNNEVRSYIRNEGLHNIHIIPFRDVTTPLYNMHVSSQHHQGQVNCDKYCYFPQMWEGVWTSMSFGIRALLNTSVGQ